MILNRRKSIRIIKQEHLLRNAQDLVALAEEQGVELTDEQLQAVSGGVDWERCGHGAPIH
jgi:bacteriocin-like protein